MNISTPKEYRAELLAKNVQLSGTEIGRRLDFYETIVAQIS